MTVIQLQQTRSSWELVHLIDEHERVHLIEEHLLPGHLAVVSPVGVGCLERMERVPRRVHWLLKTKLG